MRRPSMMLAGALLLVVCVAGPARAEIGIVAGYRYIDTDELESEHDTHPGDSFLPGANRPNSAGTTSLDETDWLLFGGRFTKTRDRSVISVDLGILLGPDETNFQRRQNLNDFRPSTEGSFIYSQAEYGIGSSVSFSYEIRKVLLGIEGQMNAIRLEHGWERFGRREKADDEIITLLSLGPKIGFIILDAGTIELSLQAGNATVAQLSFSAVF